MNKPTFLDELLKDFEDLKTHPIYSKMPPVIFDDSIKLLTKLAKGECTIDTILEGATEREKKSYHFLLAAVDSVEKIKEAVSSPDVLEKMRENSNSFMLKIVDGDIETPQALSKIYIDKYKETMLEKENYEELERLKKANKI